MPVMGAEALPLAEITAVSPLDGRYAGLTAGLRPYCSEYALIRYRTLVEVRWLEQLASPGGLPELAACRAPLSACLEQVMATFGVEDAARVKAIERITNHDVKAIEYYLRERLEPHAELHAAVPFVHFACTSEDINNLAYGLMLKDLRAVVLLPAIAVVAAALGGLAHAGADAAMLARTHGQPASPTTMGKEIANVLHRVRRQVAQLQDAEILGKFNGAVGNFNAHLCAYPAIDWLAVSRAFVTGLGLAWNPYTTQIEPHDGLAELFAVVMRLNTVFIDYCRDTWTYVSCGYFRQKRHADEVGSSTMPHKVNPIDFENAEGNLGVANALLAHLAGKLPISRLQRDLTDSTVLRNIGVGLGHSLIGYHSLARGMSKLELNRAALDADLAGAWEVLAEPIQTVMRKHGIADSYEQLKTLTRGRAVDRATLLAFIDTLAIAEDDKARLRALTPATYTGIAARQARDI